MHGQIQAVDNPVDHMVTRKKTPMQSLRVPSLVAAVGLMAAVACQHALAPVGDTAVLSVVPAGGATGVDPSQPVVIEFTAAMEMGMQQYAALHVGDATGPVVPGTWTFSSDARRLTFTPAAPLTPQTRYPIHLGGGMLDASGNGVDFTSCASQFGGQWAIDSMMGGSMMGGGTNMMGTGWQGADGTYGMVFLFTTA